MTRGNSIDKMGESCFFYENGLGKTNLIKFSLIKPWSIHIKIHLVHQETYTSIISLESMLSLLQGLMLYHSITIMILCQEFHSKNSDEDRLSDTDSIPEGDTST